MLSYNLRIYFNYFPCLGVLEPKYFNSEFPIKNTLQKVVLHKNKLINILQNSCFDELNLTMFIMLLIK